MGRVLLHRYEIIELLNVGGMGLVYKAQHRPLDRTVALKLIHPQLLVDEDIVQRFLVEAQIASRLNHPNIVSIHDFGRTPAAEGGDLILVMELLMGPSLSALLRLDARLPIPRVADILCQTLGALGEAHYHGVTHRDVKPANILLEPSRSGGERVKLIDFGIARIGMVPRITRAGQVLGTPNYMAPEQMSGATVGPSADLYAVGVLLFRMLAGRLPFSGSPEAIMAQQRFMQCPDPRLVAPERDIPPALAELCMKALAYDPADRFPSAEALAQALLQAATKSWTGRHSSLFRSEATPYPEARDTVQAQPPGPQGWSRALVASAMGTRSTQDEPTATMPLFRGIRRDAPADPGLPRLVGRRDDLAWATARLAETRGALGFVLWGRAGVGRTRLLREICDLVPAPGGFSISITPPSPPASEVSYSGLRAIIGRIAAATLAHPLLVTGQASSDPVEADGLRLVFGSDAAGTAEGARSRAVAALTWAVRGAANATAPARLIVAIDDADRMDGPSRAALAVVLGGERIGGAVMLATTERPPARPLAPGLVAREIRGLSRVEVGRMMGRADLARLLEPTLGAIEPLYVEQLVRWVSEHGSEGLAPAPLAAIIEARLQSLAPAPRRALQAVAVTGGGDLHALAALVPDPEVFHDGLFALANAGFVDVHGSMVSVPHALFARLAVAMAPAGAASELHRRAADALAAGRGPVELAAHHAIQGQPDFAAFLLVEDAARRRALLDDDDGAIAMLFEGLLAARDLFLRGDADGASGWIVFAQKLGQGLARVGRTDEAAGVLLEALDAAPPDDVRRAFVLEQLASIASQRGRSQDAETWHREALEIGKRLGDDVLVERLTTLLDEPRSGPRSPRPTDGRAPTTPRGHDWRASLTPRAHDWRATHTPKAHDWRAPLTPKAHEWRSPTSPRPMDAGAPTSPDARAPTSPRPPDARAPTSPRPPDVRAPTSPRPPDVRAPTSPRPIERAEPSSPRRTEPRAPTPREEPAEREPRAATQPQPFGPDSARRRAKSPGER